MQEVNDFERELEICREKARRANELYARAVELEKTDPLQATRLYYQDFLENSHQKAIKRLFNSGDLGSERVDEKLNYEGSSEDIFYRGLQASGGIGRACSYVTAVEYFKHVANKNSNEPVVAEAKFFLGDCYYAGKSVPKNLSQAMNWYRKAAEQGFAPAQYSLGNYYRQTKGVGQDLEEAVNWYRKAAEQGFAPAQYSLGNYYRQTKGVGQDLGEAVKWYRKAAEQGFAPAEYNLGGCYYRGDGVGKDFAEAVECFRKAAEQGYGLAQDRLARCYYRDEGVVRNLAEAVKWFRKAAAQKNEGAKKALLELYSKHEVSIDVNAIEDYVQDAHLLGESVVRKAFVHRASQDLPILDASDCLSLFDRCIAMEKNPDGFFESMKAKSAFFGTFYRNRLFFRFCEKLTPVYQIELCYMMVGEAMPDAGKEKIIKILEKIDANKIENPEHLAQLYEMLHQLNASLDREEMATTYFNKLNEVTLPEGISQQLIGGGSQVQETLPAHEPRGGEEPEQKRAKIGENPHLLLPAVETVSSNDIQKDGAEFKRRRI